MTGREALGLAPGDRVTIGTLKALIRLDASPVGIHVRHTGAVTVVPIGRDDDYFSSLSALRGQEPVLELSLAEVVDFYVWCCALLDVCSKNNASSMNVTNAVIWKRLRVDFVDRP